MTVRISRHRAEQIVGKKSIDPSPRESRFPINKDKEPKEKKIGAPPTCETIYTPLGTVAEDYSRHFTATLI